MLFRSRDVRAPAVDAEWQPREWDPKYALYCWGPDVPADFIVNKEEP